MLKIAKIIICPLLLFHRDADDDSILGEGVVDVCFLLDFDFWRAIYTKLTNYVFS